MEKKKEEEPLFDDASVEDALLELERERKAPEEEEDEGAFEDLLDELEAAPQQAPGEVGTESKAGDGPDAAIDAALARLDPWRQEGAAPDDDALDEALLRRPAPELLLRELGALVASHEAELERVEAAFAAAFPRTAASRCAFGTAQAVLRAGRRPLLAAGLEEAVAEGAACLEELAAALHEFSAPSLDALQAAVRARLPAVGAAEARLEGLYVAHTHLRRLLSERKACAEAIRALANGPPAGAPPPGRAGPPLPSDRVERLVADAEAGRPELLGLGFSRADADWRAPVGIQVRAALLVLSLARRAPALRRALGSKEAAEAAAKGLSLGLPVQRELRQHGLLTPWRLQRLLRAEVSESIAVAAAFDEAMPQLAPRRPWLPHDARVSWEPMAGLEGYDVGRLSSGHPNWFFLAPRQAGGAAAADLPVLRTLGVVGIGPRVLATLRRRAGGDPALLLAAPSGRGPPGENLLAWCREPRSEAQLQALARQLVGLLWRVADLGYLVPGATPERLLVRRAPDDGDRRPQLLALGEGGRPRSLRDCPQLVAFLAGREGQRDGTAARHFLAAAMLGLLLLRLDGPGVPGATARGLARALRLLAHETARVPAEPAELLRHLDPALRRDLHEALRRVPAATGCAAAGDEEPCVLRFLELLQAHQRPGPSPVRALGQSYAGWLPAARGTGGLLAGVDYLEACGVPGQALPRELQFVDPSLAAVDVALDGDQVFEEQQSRGLAARAAEADEQLRLRWRQARDRYVATHRGPEPSELLPLPVAAAPEEDGDGRRRARGDGPAWRHVALLAGNAARGTPGRPPSTAVLEALDEQARELRRLFGRPELAYRWAAQLGRLAALLRPRLPTRREACEAAAREIEPACPPALRRGAEEVAAEPGDCRRAAEGYAQLARRLSPGGGDEGLPPGLVDLVRAHFADDGQEAGHWLATLEAAAGATLALHPSPRRLQALWPFGLWAPGGPPGAPAAAAEELRAALPRAIAEALGPLPPLPWLQECCAAHLWLAGEAAAVAPRAPPPAAGAAGTFYDDDDGGQEAPASEDAERRRAAIVERFRALRSRPGAAAPPLPMPPPPPRATDRAVRLPNGAAQCTCDEGLRLPLMVHTRPGQQQCLHCGSVAHGAAPTRGAATPWLAPRDDDDDEPRRTPAVVPWSSAPPEPSSEEEEEESLEGEAKEEEEEGSTTSKAGEPTAAAHGASGLGASEDDFRFDTKLFRGQPEGTDPLATAALQRAAMLQRAYDASSRMPREALQLLLTAPAEAVEKYWKRCFVLSDAPQGVDRLLATRRVPAGLFDARRFERLFGWSEAYYDEHYRRAGRPAPQLAVYCFTPCFLPDGAACDVHVLNLAAGPGSEEAERGLQRLRAAWATALRVADQKKLKRVLWSGTGDGLRELQDDAARRGVAFEPLPRGAAVPGRRLREIASSTLVVNAAWNPATLLGDAADGLNGHLGGGTAMGLLGWPLTNPWLSFFQTPAAVAPAAPPPRRLGGGCHKTTTTALNKDNSCYLDALFMAMFHSAGSPYAARLEARPPSAISICEQDVARAIAKELQQLAAALPQPLIDAEEVVGAVGRVRRHLDMCHMQDGARWASRDMQDASALYHALNSILQLPTMRLLGQAQLSRLEARPRWPLNGAVDRDAFHAIKFDGLHADAVPDLDAIFPQLMRVTGGDGGAQHLGGERLMSAELLVVHFDRLADSGYRANAVSFPPSLRPTEGRELQLQSVVAYKPQHFICYYRCGSRWFLADDTRTETSHVGAFEQLLAETARNCTLLFYWPGGAAAA
jgi:hypothetical protein